MSLRNSRSRKVAPAHLERVVKVFDLCGSTQKEFAAGREISVSTLRNFLSGEAVEKRIFDGICHALELQVVEICEDGVVEEDFECSTPFITGNPIRESRYFFGRERELKRIFRILDGKPLQNVAIVGPKRIGKTSLLHYLQRITVTPEADLRPGQWREWLKRPELYRWVFVDFQDVQVQSESGLLGHILRSLKIPLPSTCDLASFMALLPLHMKQPTVIMFDAVEVGLRRCPELDDRFWECLRSLACNSAQGNLAYVVSVPVLPSELAASYGYTSPFFNTFGYTVFLQEFTEAEAREFVANSPTVFAPEDIDWILEQSQSLPLRLQILCRERLVSLENDEGDDWRIAALLQIQQSL
jgi:AAA ATPase domain